uniref:Reverse transcriptase domain-containing protein n=1 Tax=Tanacetum cinerariifolium TaxID=118510 RepID=A0A6L2N7I4_TANCI|nr:reverse transcriptase domain-containing protein [Tanacetum cinerariifolium]
MFCQTLSGAARNWFNDYDPKSMDNFEELCQKFLEKFSQQKRYAKDLTEIHGIRRRLNEGLQAFMNRFKSKSSHIKGVPLVLRISTFMHSHSHPKLAKKITDKIPKTVDEMFERVGEFIKGQGGVKVINMVSLKGNRKRPSEGAKPGITKEIAFPTVPQGHLTDSLIVREVMIEGFKVRRIYVDGGSSFEIMYEHFFKSFSAHTRSRLRKSSASLIRFSREAYHPLGLADLRVTMGEPGRSKTVLMKFTFVKCHSPYNVILGRTGMRSLGEVASMIHSMIKFLMANGLATLKISKEALRECKHIKEIQISCRETQWRQHMEQVLQIRKQIAPQSWSIPSIRPGKEPMLLDEPRVGDSVMERVVVIHNHPSQPMKEMGELHTLVIPKEDEILMVCLRQKSETISFVLFTERDELQVPINYISHPLQGMKICYTTIEEMVLALVHVMRCLRKYFKTHDVKEAAERQAVKEFLAKEEQEPRVPKKDVGKLTWKVPDMDEHFDSFRISHLPNAPNIESRCIEAIDNYRAGPSNQDVSVGIKTKQSIEAPNTYSKDTKGTREWVALIKHYQEKKDLQKNDWKPRIRVGRSQWKQLRKNTSDLTNFGKSAISPSSGLVNAPTKWLYEFIDPPKGTLLPRVQLATTAEEEVVKRKGGAENRLPMLKKDMYDSWKSIMELYMMNRQHERMILEFVEQGLPPEFYALVSNHKVAKELWKRIQLLMQGTSLMKQERECKLYDEFDKFSYKKGETLRDFYFRFSLLLNDMNIYNMKPEQFQVNNKFLNTLPLEWSKFVTDVKLVRDFHKTNIDQLHAYLGQHEFHTKEVRLMHERNSDPLALVATHQMTHTSGKQRTVICYNYKGEGYMSKQCTKPKRKREDSWFKDKVLLVQAQANGQVLHEEELAFLVDLGIAEVALMANLSHCGLDVLAEVHNPDNVDTNMINQAVQAMPSSEQSNVVNHLETEITSFQNPFYLKKAQQLEPKLYDGNVIEKTSAIVSLDSEETLMLAEESRLKILLKQKDPMMLEKKVNTTPLDYAVLNQLSQHFKTRFVPQTKLYDEQAFWSQNSVNSLEPTLYSTPTKVEVPKELPKVSMVNTSLKKLKHHLAGFDVVVKERTTATAITEGSLGFEHTTSCFRDQIIPFVKALKDLFNTFDQYLIDELSEVQNVFYQMEQLVEQHRLESKTFEVKMNQVLNENERLLKQVISKDIVKVIVNSSVDTASVNVYECEKCLKLKIELLNKKNFVEKEIYDKLFRNYTTLEKHCISLEVDTQLNLEIFQRDNYEKDLVITALKDDLRKLKGKALADDAVTSHSITPEMLNVHMEPLALKLLNNRTSHSDYLRHTQEQAAILREVV